MTIAVPAMVVGLSEVAVAVNTELNGISNAIGALQQGYAFMGCASTKTKGGAIVDKNFIVGSRFTDAHDDCDDNLSCDLVCGAPAADTCG